MKKSIKANEVMTQNFVRMDGMQTISEAIKAMKDNKVRVIFVNKRDQQDVHGILVLSDIAKQVLAKDRSPERVNIYEIMAKPIVSVPPEMDIRYCARLFQRFGLSHAPVIANDEILGMVGYKELVLHELQEI